MATIVAYGNSYNGCLLLLQSKGYRLWSEIDGDKVLYFARQGDETFLAYTPPELLGIVCLWEGFGERWNIQEPDLLTRLADEREAGADQ